MKVLIFGAGAIGGYIGCSLFDAGHQVTFLEQCDFIDALGNKELLLVDEDEEEVRISSPVIYDDISKIPDMDFDFAVLAVKAYHVDAFIDQLKPYLNRLPMIISFQNGVETELKLVKAFGIDKVIPGTITTAVGKEDRFTFVVEKKRGMALSGSYEKCAPIIEVFNDAYLECDYINQAQGMKWSKMLTNMLGNASSAILDMSPEEIFDSSLVFELERLQISEALKVMRKMNIPVVNLPKTPVKILIRVLTLLPIFISKWLLKPFLGKGRGDKMPSFHIDLYSGNPRSEVDYLNGAVCRIGESVGVSSPVNRRLTEILLQLTGNKGMENPYRRNPKKLMKDILANG